MLHHRVNQGKIDHSCWRQFRLDGHFALDLMTLAQICFTCSKAGDRVSKCDLERKKKKKMAS